MCCEESLLDGNHGGSGHGWTLPVGAGAAVSRGLILVMEFWCCPAQWRNCCRGSGQAGLWCLTGVWAKAELGNEGRAGLEPGLPFWMFSTLSQTEFPMFTAQMNIALVMDMEGRPSCHWRSHDKPLQKVPNLKLLVEQLQLIEYPDINTLEHYYNSPLSAPVDHRKLASTPRKQRPWGCLGMVFGSLMMCRVIRSGCSGSGAGEAFC